MPTRPLMPPLAAALAAVALAAPASAQPQGRLTIGMAQYPSNFHPSIDAMLAKAYVLAMTRRPVAGFDPDWQETCFLCEGLPSLTEGGAEIVTRDDGTEGIDATYRLKEDLFWGDGMPITTEDVVFTWEVGRHPEAGITNFDLYAKDIVGITAHDDREFTIHFDEVKCSFATIGRYEILPAHLERPVFDQDPATYRMRTTYDTDTTNPGLHFGPYRITETVPGARITLGRNPEWRGTDPGFEEIVVRVIERSAALEANLLAGDIDMIAGEVGIPLDQALGLRDRVGDRFSFVIKPGLFYEHIDLNLDNPILSDQRVRQALLYAIDRQLIVDQLFGGTLPVANANISPLDAVYSDDVPVYEHDPDAAAALLEEAGWTEMRGGVRQSAEGDPLRLVISTTAGNRTRELVQQVLQAQWKAVGIDVVIENHPPRVLFGDRMTRRNFNAMSLFAWISSPRNIPRTTLHSTMIPSEENSWIGQNFTGFADAETDRILDDLETVCGEAENQALWARLQRIYAEQLPALPLYFRADAFILPPWLEGVTPTGHLFPSTLWVENWRDTR